MIFFDFSALGGPGFPARHSAPQNLTPQNHGFFKGFGRVLASRRVPPFSWRLRSTKNQYFLSPEHQKPIFSVPGPPKINIFYPRSTKNQYFLSPEYQKSIFYVPEHQKLISTVPGAQKINIFCQQGTKNQYSLFPE